MEGEERKGKGVRTLLMALGSNDRLQTCANSQRHMVASPLRRVFEKQGGERQIESGMFNSEAAPIVTDVSHKR